MRHAEGLQYPEELKPKAQTNHNEALRVRVGVQEYIVSSLGQFGSGS